MWLMEKKHFNFVQNVGHRYNHTHILWCDCVTVSKQSNTLLKYCNSILKLIEYELKYLAH